MIDKDELYNNLNSGVIDERLAIFRINLRKNLPLISEFGGLRPVSAAIKNRHAVIAGAGPSLVHNLEAIREISERGLAVVICADMAASVLLKSGIVPDYVISCETRPYDFFSGLDTRKINLLAFSCISHSNLRKWRGPLSFYNWLIEGEHYSRLWDEAGADLGFLATGSIVTTQAVSLAAGSGVRSILLAGNDLAFKWEFYAAGAAASGKMLLDSSRLSPSETEHAELGKRNIHYKIVREGRTYFANHQFLAAKVWLEDLFRNGSLPVFDCSVPGCSPSAVRHMSSREYAENIIKAEVSNDKTS